MTEERLREIEKAIEWRARIGCRPNVVEETVPTLIAEIRRCWAKIEAQRKKIKELKKSQGGVYPPPYEDDCQSWEGIPDV